MNKKADGKIISVYWFIMLVVVAGGVFLMVNLYYGAPYDVREIEANILSQKVADCIYPNGKLNPDMVDYQRGIFREQFLDNFAENCSLNFNLVNEWDTLQYYVEVNFYNIPDYRNSVLNLSEGNFNWKFDCDLQDQNDKKYERLVTCSKKEFYAKSMSEEIYLIKILSVVRKTEQNVK